MMGIDNRKRWEYTQVPRFRITLKQDKGSGVEGMNRALEPLRNVAVAGAHYYWNFLIIGGDYYGVAECIYGVLVK